LSPTCKRLLRNAGIPAEEAAEHLGITLNCLYFDTRRLEEESAEVRQCLKMYKRQQVSGGRSSSIGNKPDFKIDSINRDSEDSPPKARKARSDGGGDESARSTNTDEEVKRVKRKPKKKKDEDSEDEGKEEKKQKKKKKEEDEPKKEEEEEEKDSSKGRGSSTSGGTRKKKSTTNAGKDLLIHENPSPLFGAKVKIGRG